VGVEFVLAQQMTCALTRGHGGCRRLFATMKTRRRRRFVSLARGRWGRRRLVRFASAFGGGRRGVVVHISGAGVFGDKKKSSFSSVIFCEEEREETFRELMQRVEKIEEMNRKAGVYINI